MSDPTHTSASLLGRVLEHAAQRGERDCVVVVSARGAEVRRTFATVATDAGRAAACLREHGVGKGDRVVLIGTHHGDFYAAWLGAVWLGAVPCVLAEPSVRIHRAIYRQRLGALLARVEPRLLAFDEGALGEEDGESLVAGLPVPTLTYRAAASFSAPPPPVVDAAPDDLLLLQHSSGTTGLQKGVMLSHGAVAAHGTAYGRALGLNPEDPEERVASWLPLYHDMGLIACFVLPLHAGVGVSWLSPFEWIAAPRLLLEVITRHRATLAWLPNFAFPLLAQRVRSTEGLDLSSLRRVVNCSEPVTAAALDAFADRFATVGFRRSALATCFALAENVFAVTASAPDQPPRTRRVDRAVWQREHRAVRLIGKTGETGETGDTGEAAHHPIHVSSGLPIEGCAVRIADESGETLPAGSAGRVLIRSPFLFQGYFRRPDLNGDLFDGQGFYDTGDLGYRDEDGHLYVLGRRDDLLILAGKNVYPHDVEAAVAEVEGVRPGRVVSFGVPVRHLGTEGLVVLLESGLAAVLWPEVARQVRQAIPARLDLDAADIKVLAPGSLRKSTSGKLARQGNRQWYLEGRFGPVPRQLGEEA
jgi:fatty-acyl-CoA synthase